MRRTTKQRLGAVLLVTGIAGALDLSAFGGQAAGAATTSSHRTLGARLSPEHNDGSSYLRRHTAGVVPESADLTEFAMPIGDQGQVGSCVSWAISYGLVGWLARQAGVADPAFAPMYTYSQTNGGVDEGSFPTDALDVLVKQGVDTRADYWQGDEDWWDLPDAAERANAKPQRISGYDVLFTNGRDGATAVADLKTALAAGHPTAVTMAVRDGFDTYTDDGYAVDTDTTSDIRGYHEVLALGYDARGLLIQNSWGTEWSPTGMRFLSWDVVAQDVLEAETVRGFAGADADTTAPTVAVSAPSLTYLGTATSSTVPVTFGWDATDDAAVQATTVMLSYGGAWHDLRLSAGTRRASYNLSTGSTYQLAVRAGDAAGNWSPWTYSARITPALLQNTSTAVARTGTWKRYSASAYSGGSQDSSTTGGSTFSVAFTGSGFAWDATRATNRGQARVWLDGTYLGVVDTRSGSTAFRSQVLTRTFSSRGTHRLRVQVLGTSGRPAVDLDAISLI